jgi:O-methyltransferase
MSKIILTIIRAVINRFGINIVRYHKTNYPTDLNGTNLEICKAVEPYTMTSPERINALVDAVNYVVTNKIDGAMVECGVWKGGSTMAIAIALKLSSDENRDLYLYDTFAGMSAPSDADISIDGDKAQAEFDKTKISQDSSTWCLSNLAEVKQNVSGTGYRQDKIHFIEGKVEDTIPANMPEKIALLRLDTDWYESTKHELTHLFPLLQPKAVLIIDDYGYWEGAKKAVDEYIAEKNICILLNRIDNTGRIAIVTA